jgi:GNAT superfamily N-acetyltransferase/predicted transcriptional regulator
MDFYDRVGVVALGSRLRRLGDRFAKDAEAIYALYGTELQPRWFPVFYLLGERGEQSISAIAGEIGHTHASVSQIIREMVDQGYVILRKRKKDGRKTFAALSSHGRAAKAKLEPHYTDVRAAVEKLLAESEQRLWAAVTACERALDSQSLLQRVLQEKKSRDRASIRIVDYEPRFAKAFKRLNEAWIKHFFKIEEADRRALDHPDDTILKPGGHILMALDGDKAVGTCALIPHGECCFELAKMAVAAAARGQGVGRLLGEAAMTKAKEHGANRLYLESNTALAPAISLYRKLGFKEISGQTSPYQRCNIFMERRIESARGPRPKVE